MPVNSLTSATRDSCKMCGASYLSERLRHLSQKVLGELHRLVHGEVQTAVVDVFLNPARQLPPLVCTGVTLRTGQGVAHSIRRSTAAVKLKAVTPYSRTLSAKIMMP